MKNISRLFVSILILVGCYGPPAFAGELKPLWLTHACYEFTMSVNNKFSNAKNYVAKYVLKAAKGSIFVAKKTATDFNSAMVVFPKDFRNEKLGISASIDCYFGQQYTWEIYVDDVLKDSGTIGFTRKKNR